MKNQLFSIFKDFSPIEKMMALLIYSDLVILGTSMSISILTGIMAPLEFSILLSIVVMVMFACLTCYHLWKGPDISGK